MINLWKHLKVNQIKKSFNSKNHILCSNTDIFPIAQNLENKSPLPSFRIIFRFLFSVLSDRVLFRVLSPRFLVCRVPLVALTTGGVLQWFSVLNILIGTDVLILSMGNSMQLLEIWANFWNMGFILDFWLGSEYACAESFIYIQKYSSRGSPNDSFSEKFSKLIEKSPWWSTFQEYFSKKW